MPFRQYQCTPDEAAAIVATIHDYAFQPEEVVNVVFLVQRTCPNCGEPHIITVSGTCDSIGDVIRLLSGGIVRMLEAGDDPDA